MENRRHRDERSLPVNKRYIQHVETNAKGESFIVCFLPEQAKAFVKQHRVSMDLAYKRVKGCYYEFVIANYDENFNRREFRPFLN